MESKNETKERGHGLQLKRREGEGFLIQIGDVVVLVEVKKITGRVAQLSIQGDKNKATILRTEKNEDSDHRLRRLHRV
jgi:hypothetical protein